MSGIYKITCPDGCIYVGQSNDIKNRLWNYKKTNKSKNKIHDSIDLKGLSNHVFELIHLVDESLDFDKLKEVLNELEINYIKSFDCFDTPHGLNLTSGGSSKSKVSKETKQKLSESHKGQVPWSKGIPMKPETKAKMTGEKNHGYGKKGEKSYNYGKKRTPEQNKAQSDRMKGHNKGKPFSGTKMVWTEEAINKYLRKPRPTRTPEQNKNNADARRGKKRTPEQIASFTAWRKDEEKVKRVGDNISKALKGKKRSEKYKESRKGKKLNPESIKKREATKKKESRIN
jgi:group I intron endonuclease